jgi:hypothetical protein
MTESALAKGVCAAAEGPMAFHELVPPDETERFERYASEIREIQKRRAEKHGKAERALHVKAHVGVVGNLSVTAQEPHRVGVFSGDPASYPVYVRFSNSAGIRQPDGAPDARGMAVKLVGVPGPKLIPGLEQALTQDFLFVSDPAIPFRDPDEFLTFVRAAKDGPLPLLPRFFSGFGFGRGFAILRRLLGAAKVSSFATHAFFTAVPVAFGATAAKLALFPLAPAEAPAAHGPDALRLDLLQRLGVGALSWTLSAQFFADDESTPIEDASVEWTGPWVELGKLSIPGQDPDSEVGQRISRLVEELSFDPWHAVEAHRPLGAIMRARAVAYRESVLGRKAAPEPDSVISLT